ncbi:putative RNA 2'-phosphotransferase [Anaerobacterium chartisolvens]|uniref:Probable RNA 2'-phosphotransferase n=1 Tax=Anaerobacterium chartisolvens TaxID=1297424 RepID=A0A369BBH0_9FIRM|nr:RNA 2'-phosphotransferase [Anaerobacterium chartisolvens]RCX18761.1 putative RNA 2'-phosphotransferase [Anaerobacterium chartisolvens]
MDYSKLSKEISYALRHVPWEYELELDEEGWVDIKQLLSSLSDSMEWQELSEKDLHMMIKNSDKKRHEIASGKIRALYGHSIPQKILKDSKVPPEILYHGTARRFIPLIKEKGLLPQNRQYVHLSVDTEIALQVGKRRDSEPIILKINAMQASQEGIVFYQGNDKVWLTDAIPNKYINI